MFVGDSFLFHRALAIFIGILFENRPYSSLMHF